ncbi:MAG: hypothetical protein U0795_14405 [Pirellulales bacterium]
MTAAQNIRPAAGYVHTQHGPLWLTLCSAAALCFWLAMREPSDHARWVAAAVGAIVILLAGAFHHLTVQDQGDQLEVRFGPWPLFRRRVKYADIVSAIPGRTSILDGWGIHYSLSGGWVWNLWGRDCVVVKLKSSTLRIGTDDAAQLAAFLQQKLNRTNPNSSRP